MLCPFLKNILLLLLDLSKDAVPSHDKDMKGVDVCHLLYEFSQKNIWKAKDFTNLDFLSKCGDISTRLYMSYSLDGREKSAIIENVYGRIIMPSFHQKND